MIPSLSVRDGWKLAAGLLILTAAILSAAYWPVYPYFLDSYYHLSVIQGFHEAGGPVLHAFWEAAPEGRPHLYPPLFHLISLPVVEWGSSLMALAKGWCAAIFPLLLLTAWLVFSRITTARESFLILLALSLPYSFYLGCLNYLPATLVLVAALGILLALFRHRWLAGGLLLACAFWVHAGLPWLVALGLLLFGLLEPAYRKTAWKILLLGLMGASPWLLHLARHASFFQLQPRGEEHSLETPVALVALGLFGWVVAFRRGGIWRFLAALGLGFLPMLSAYRFRFFATQGLFPWMILAGVALEAAAGKLRRPWKAVLVLLALGFASPTLHVGPSGWKIVWADATLFHLTESVPSKERATANPLFFSKFMEPLAKEVRAHTSPEELIYSNISYFAGMIRVVTERAMTNQLLREMPEQPLDHQIRAARLIVWLKESLEGPPSPRLQALALRYHLRPVAETEVAILYLNPQPAGRRQVSAPVMPWQSAVGIILLVGLLIARDLRRCGDITRGRRGPLPDR